MLTVHQWRNNGFVVRDKSLFLRAATTAPRKPIHKVKCCTKTGDATTPVVPKILVITSIAGSDTRAMNTNNATTFSVDLILYINKKGLRVNVIPFLFL